MRRAKASTGGFTLLEMMIALSILAISLTWLIESSIRAVDSENHAKMVTTATFLARQQMVDLESELQEKGMADTAFESEKEGDFEEDGFKRFKWKRVVEKITLPGQDKVQGALGGLAGGMGGPGGAGGSSSTGGTGGGLGLAGMGSANMFANSFGIVKDVLEQGIRKATIKVVWTEHNQERVVEVSQYLTDPRKVDQAIQIPGGNMPGMPGIPGMGTSTGGGLPGLGTSSGTGAMPSPFPPR